ncbi:MAG TPA: diguanylate cyclase [Thermoanaerobaculia bacterium]|nr:diguanylate cyclase [Thermoanaerobaculia bacterium]
MPDTLRRRYHEQAGDLTPLRALVVDDSEAYRTFMAALVSTFGFEVTACADGAEAFGAIRGGSAYHLFIIDCEMPRMNGMQLISAIRELEQQKDGYAIMLTVRDDVETRINALRLGFDDFMPKSAGEPEIAARLSVARRLITRQKRLDDTVRTLYGLATRDELTGLFNRRFFFHEAERLLQEKADVNLVFFDLDEFKNINDTLGHLAGDRILRDIGGLFLRRTRNEDLIARYGGDEFVMLVPQLAPPEVEALAVRMTSEIASCQWTFGTDTLNVGVTWGVSCSSLLDNPTIAQLLSAGDRDLYKNKWMKKHPHDDPHLYTYDTRRDARVIELVTNVDRQLRIQSDE